MLVTDSMSMCNPIARNKLSIEQQGDKSDYYCTNYVCDCISEHRWNGIPDLLILLCTRSLKEVIIRKCLYSSGFADRQ